MAVVVNMPFIALITIFFSLHQLADDSINTLKLQNLFSTNLGSAQAFASPK